MSPFPFGISSHDNSDASVGRSVDWGGDGVLATIVAMVDASEGGRGQTEESHVAAENSNSNNAMLASGCKLVL